MLLKISSGEIYLDVFCFNVTDSLTFSELCIKDSKTEWGG